MLRKKSPAAAGSASRRSAFVLLVLLLEGFLILSQHFQWFAFNGHKSWTVLICLAMVGAAFVLMFLWFLVALLFRLRFQFTIRSLLLLTLVVAISFSWLAVARQQAEKQRVVVAEIQGAGGKANYDYQRDLSGAWIAAPHRPGQPGCASCWETTSSQT